MMAPPSRAAAAAGGGGGGGGGGGSGAPADLSRAELKKKIRDLERLLRKDTLPADLRRDMDRKLKAYRVMLDGKSEAAVASKVSAKYKMVRFFGTARRCPASKDD